MQRAFSENGKSGAQADQTMGLRLRLGVILGLAMLPLLLLSVGKSVLEYRRDVVQSQRMGTAALDIAVEGVDNLLSDVETTLATVDGVLTRDNCGEVFATAVGGSAELLNLAWFDTSATTICTDRPLIAPETAQGLIASVSSDKPTTSLLLEPTSDTARIVFARTTFERDRPLRTLSAMVDWSALWDGLGVLKSDLDADVAIISSSGRTVFASRPGFPPLSRSQLDELLSRGVDIESRFSVRAANGERRTLTLRSTQVPDTFIAVSRPGSSFLSWQRLNLLTGSLIPVLAWIFAFAAIWVAVDQLVLRHVRRLRATALNFATGSMSARNGELDDAPRQLRQLGRSFDLMAERISEREASLQATVEEKTVLLREIHHRVKNNLQIIISLLNMQQRELDDPRGRQAIEEARNRVGAIALVHRSIYESDDLSDMDVEPFLDQLVGDLYRSLDGQVRGIRLISDIDNAEFDADMAIPIALFVTEAVTNAIIHGVPDGGILRVSFRREDTSEGEAVRTLMIADTGAGPGEDTSTATGWRLMRGFARQVGGTFDTVTNAHGFEVRLVF